MEVHHHPHVGKKNFKEYVLEGLMIFLAVSMGFIAENIREHFVEKETEKKYVESYLQDLKSDLVRFDRVINQNKITILQIDQTLKTLHQPFLNDSSLILLYKLNNTNTLFMNMLFNERTSSQLKMAGGYKLISKQAVSDSMAKRDLDINWNEMMRNRLYNLGFEIKTKAVPKLFDSYLAYNYDNEFKKTGDSMNNTITRSNFSKEINKYALLSSNRNDIVYYSNLLIMYQKLLAYYNTSLKDYKGLSINQIALIEKEYHLE